MTVIVYALILAVILTFFFGWLFMLALGILGLSVAYWEAVAASFLLRIVFRGDVDPDWIAKDKNA